LETGAKLALQAMLLEMRADGVDDIQVTSAYRSFDYQKTLFEAAMKRETATISEQAYAVLGDEYIRNHYTSQGKTKLDDEDAKQVVLSDLAYPGTSEHQTGLCVDFVTSKTGDAVVEAFEDTEAFAWLQNNAYKFGFILRYPKDKVATTGYSYEPWHYRFVGREAATDIRLSGFCLEEYLIALQ
jgi:D-alanyl-D-alanine carboxypeptidase